jgi:hypothetical protein
MVERFVHGVRWAIQLESFNYNFNGVGDSGRLGGEGLWMAVRNIIERVD